MSVTARSRRNSALDSNTEGCSDAELLNRRTLDLSWVPAELAHLHGLQGRKKPAELFRKDLISAMKMADSEQLDQQDFWEITDAWRQDWETGVQVPVNQDGIKVPLNVLKSKTDSDVHGSYGFKLARKLLHAMNDETFQQGIHHLHAIHSLAETVCRYDLDDLDVTWLNQLNKLLSEMGIEALNEHDMERIMEELENKSYDNMEKKIRTEEGLGIEYDEDVVCDICLSPDSEDTNEMVFCDKCDICVHQACYGVTSIPDGSWLCRTCSLGIRPDCIFCPNVGGAMKCSKSGTKWAHVSCALWIPEVSIACTERMEPITNLSQIPSSRWNLTCSVCKERNGACIQCSVKTCKTAFHVTCAFKSNLEMRTILEPSANDVSLKSYCAKHTKKLRDGCLSPSKDLSGYLSASPIIGTPKKAISQMTEEEKMELRSHRLKKLEEEFFSCVTTDEIAASVKVEHTVVDFVLNYWVLKRKCNYNKPLLLPKTEEEEILYRQEEDSLMAKARMFVHLRQDLERVRNLCYMVSRREKARRQYYSTKEDVFRLQAKICLAHADRKPGARETNFVLNAHRGNNGLYDRHADILAVARLRQEREWEREREREREREQLHDTDDDTDIKVALKNKNRARQLAFKRQASNNRQQHVAMKRMRRRKLSSVLTSGRDCTGSSPVQSRAGEVESLRPDDQQASRCTQLEGNSPVPAVESGSQTLQHETNEASPPSADGANHHHRLPDETDSLSILDRMRPQPACMDDEMDAEAPRADETNSRYSSDSAAKSWPLKCRRKRLSASSKNVEGKVLAVEEVVSLLPESKSSNVGGHKNLRSSSVAEALKAKSADVAGADDSVVNDSLNGHSSGRPGKRSLRSDKSLADTGDHQSDVVNIGSLLSSPQSTSLSQECNRSESNSSFPAPAVLRSQRSLTVEASSNSSTLRDSLRSRSSAGGPHV